MFIKCLIIKIFIYFITIALLARLEIFAANVSCPLASQCKSHPKTEEICRYDDAAGCIRKYPSKCHLDVAACNLRQNFTDFSNDYCSMDTYFCEEGYERWTIFFGHE